MSDENDFDRFWSKYENYNSTHKKVIDSNKIKWANEHVIPILRDFAADTETQFFYNFSLDSVNIKIVGDKINIIREEKYVKDIISKSDNCTLTTDANHNVILELYFNLWSWRTC